MVPVYRWFLWEVQGPVLYFAYDTGSRVQVISVRSAGPSTVFCLWHWFPCTGDFCEKCKAQYCILPMTLVPVYRWFLWEVRGPVLYFAYDTGSRVQVISVRSAGPSTVFCLWHWFPCTSDFCEECGPSTVFYLWHWFPCTGDFCEECGPSTVFYLWHWFPCTSDFCEKCEAQYCILPMTLVPVYRWFLWGVRGPVLYFNYDTGSRVQVISVRSARPSTVFCLWHWFPCTGDFCEKCEAQYCILPMTLFPVCRWFLWGVHGPELYFIYDTGSRVQVISVRSAGRRTVFYLWHWFPCAGDFCEECGAQNCILSMTLVPVYRWFLWGVRGPVLYFIYDTGSRVQVISVRSAGPSIPPPSAPTAVSVRSVTTSPIVNVSRDTACRYESLTSLTWRLIYLHHLTSGWFVSQNNPSCVNTCDNACSRM